MLCRSMNPILERYDYKVMYILNGVINWIYEDDKISFAVADKKSSKLIMGVLISMKSNKDNWLIKITTHIFYFIRQHMLPDSS